MTDQRLACPHCGREIELTEAVTRHVEERLRRAFDDEMKRRDRDYTQQLRAKEQELQRRFVEEQARLAQQARQQAEAQLGVRLKDLEAQVAQQRRLLEAAQRQELAFRRRQRELEERERTMTLELERTLDRERQTIREQFTVQFAEAHRLKDLEKDKKMADMLAQIEMLKSKAEQGSQQNQGEVLELELEEVLRRHCRLDEITPIAKGVRGADVIQRVHDKAGQCCGVILWEFKHNRAWNDGWIQKLKDDQRAAKADLAVLVSVVLPKDRRCIDSIDGVWVTNVPSVVGLATALREQLVQVAQARSALVGKSDKMELLYNYLSGPEFKRRVEGIVEPFRSMQEDLDAERRAMEKLWAKREKELQRVIRTATAMYGDLQGIIGSALQPVKLLELPADDGVAPPLTRPVSRESAQLEMNL